jgi:hypothetical protein
MALATPALPEAQHGIAMYGDPALPPDFAHLPHVNPDAPKGGRIVMGEVGGFDSLNPFILKGRAPWQLQYLAYEGLMGRNWDEPFTRYTALLAESVETDDARSFVEFTLNPEARFSDGSPVTVGGRAVVLRNAGHDWGAALSRRMVAHRTGRGCGRARGALHLHRTRPRIAADSGPAPDPEEGAMGRGGFRGIGHVGHSHWQRALYRGPVRSRAARCI